jgi:hypothetical protein
MSGAQFDPRCVAAFEEAFAGVEQVAAEHAVR